MTNAKRFENKIAAITGGAAGIGKAIAHRIATEGGTSVLLDRDAGMLDETAAEFKRAGLSVATRKMDVTSPESVRDAFAFIAKDFGRADAVVNSAGITGPTAVKITDYSVEAFDHVCQVNLRGSFLVTKAALELMNCGAGVPPAGKQNRGRILLIASIAGKEGNPGMCGYSASKAGVIGLVKAIGKEFAETGITINGLAPAVIRTSLVDGVAPEQVKYMTDKIPMKRCGTLDEVASLSAWILSDECSFTTGFVFDLSGGRAVY